MSPSILVAGSTGNTGTSVVETLSQLVDTKQTFAGYRILALTRDKNGGTARRFAELPHVEVVQLNYLEAITVDWLREHEVERSFVAPQATLQHFAEESHFNLALLNAGVKYHVRVATATSNMRADCPAYYARGHWALEQQLSAPEFEKLQWTSLRPAMFTSDYLDNAVEYVKKFRETGEQGTLRLATPEDIPFRVVYPGDVGVVAAHLLTSENPAIHSKARYKVHGPEDITGADTLKVVEQAIGAKVEDVRYKDASTFQSAVEGGIAFGLSKTLMTSIYRTFDDFWAGKVAEGPSDEVVAELGIVQRTVADVFNAFIS